VINMPLKTPSAEADEFASALAQLIGQNQIEAGVRSFGSACHTFAALTPGGDAAMRSVKSTP